MNYSMVRTRCERYGTRPLIGHYYFSREIDEETKANIRNPNKLQKASWLMPVN